MITVGSKLTSLAMVKRAVNEGFALKIVENAFIEGENCDGQYWSGTEVRVSYEDSAHDEYTIVHQYLADGEIFAAPMSEYDEYIKFNYWHDYDE